MTFSLYHGSYCEVPKPLTSVGRRELDFGPGFYVTRLREQAERWAKRVCVVRNLTTPILSHYDFDDSLIPDGTRRLVLENYDREWLDFITASRRGEQPWANYDIIEGGVANDRVIDTVEAYMAQLMPLDAALRELSKHRPNNQICICSQGVLNGYLHFVESYNIR